MAFKDPSIRVQQKPTPQTPPSTALPNQCPVCKNQLRNCICDKPQVKVPTTPQDTNNNYASMQYMSTKDVFVIWNLLTNFVNVSGMNEEITNDYHRVIGILKEQLRRKMN